MSQEATSTVANSSRWREPLLRVTLLALLALGMFLAGRLWSVRQVWEAREAAAQAEREKMRLHEEAIAYKNKAILLELELEKLRSP